MNQPKISIIVPTYNVEKYIERCINSILIQSFDDFELLLIDDGSIDKSGQICDDFASQDTRIKVIHKVNGGVSSAREAGFNNSTGIYIVFVDSDDELRQDALKEMFELYKENNFDLKEAGRKLCFLLASVGSSNLTQITWEITASLVDKYERRTTRTAPTFVLAYPSGLPRRLFPTLFFLTRRGQSPFHRARLPDAIPGLWSDTLSVQTGPAGFRPAG